MSADRRATARKIYEATETGNVAPLDDAVTDDVIEHPLNPGQVRGRDALKQVFGGLSMLVGDLRLTNEQVVLAGDRVAVRSTVTGTAIGP